MDPRARSGSAGTARVHASRTVAAAEDRLWRGRSGDVLLPFEPIAPAAISPALALVLGIAAKDEEQLGIAERLLERALEGSTAVRATAHMAHLDYYRGEFEAGIRRAQSAADQGDPIGRTEAALYLSVNLIALNRADKALTAGLRARHLATRLRPAALRQDLRFRVARQLVHVYVAVGAYLDADGEAQAAHVIAMRLDSERMLGTAAYLRGYARAARGDRTAVISFSEADRQFGGSIESLSRWVLYVWSLLLRDMGDHERARNLRARSGLSLPWEDPLFDLAETGRASMPALTRVPSDELPFRLATAGLIGFVGGDTRAATKCLQAAHDRFKALGLEHYRRGCALALAAAHGRAGDRRRGYRITQEELPAMLKYRLARWPWWHPRVVLELADICSGHGTAATFWKARVGDAVEVEIPSSEILRSIGLTERAATAVVTWIEHPTWSRAQLARSLGIREASVRNLLNRAREALHCDARRGPEPLRERIDELRRRPHRGVF